jgi:hypothetical protein
MTRRRRSIAGRASRTRRHGSSTADAQGVDPGELTEAVGDADAIRASTYGMKNLERVGAMLLTATTAKPGEPYDDLEELYGRLLGPWVLEMNHVAAAAVAFFNANAFTVPSFAVQPEVLRRIEPIGVLQRVQTAQLRVLTSVLAPARFARLIEQEAIDGAAAYKATDVLRDLRRGLWRELGSSQVAIDAYRRGTQRLFLDAMAERLNGRVPATDDARAFIRGELRSLSASIRTALPKTADRATRLHLEDAQDQIAKTLDPRFARTAAAATTGPIVILPGLFEEASGPVSCFPDYAIRGLSSSVH